MKTVDLDEGPEMALSFLTWYFVTLELIINIYFWYNTVHCPHFYKPTNKMPSIIFPLPSIRYVRHGPHSFSGCFAKALPQVCFRAVFRNLLEFLFYLSEFFISSSMLRINPRPCAWEASAVPLSYTLALLLFIYSVPLTSFVGLWLCFGNMHPLVVFQEMMPRS